MVIWIGDPFHYKIAADLMHSVKTGQPTVEHVTGKPAFEYFSSDAVEFDRFHRALERYGATRPLPRRFERFETWSYAPLNSAESIAREVARRWSKRGQMLGSVARRSP